MPEPTFSPGDLVRLKSGGPTMTVVRQAESKYDPPRQLVKCVWFHSPATDLWTYPRCAYLSPDILETVE